MAMQAVVYSWTGGAADAARRCPELVKLVKRTGPPELCAVRASVRAVCASSAAAGAESIPLSDWL